MVNLLDRFKVFPNVFLMFHLFHLISFSIDGFPSPGSFNSYVHSEMGRAEPNITILWMEIQRFRLNDLLKVTWLMRGKIKSQVFWWLVQCYFYSTVRQTTIKVKWINTVLRLEILSLLLFTVTVLNMENGKHTSKSI